MIPFNVEADSSSSIYLEWTKPFLLWRSYILYLNLYSVRLVFFNIEYEIVLYGPLMPNTSIYHYYLKTVDSIESNTRKLVIYGLQPSSIYTVVILGRNAIGRGLENRKVVTTFPTGE